MRYYYALSDTKSYQDGDTLQVFADRDQRDEACRQSHGHLTHCASRTAYMLMCSYCDCTPWVFATAELVDLFARKGGMVSYDLD